MAKGVTYPPGIKVVSGEESEGIRALLRRRKKTKKPIIQFLGRWRCKGFLCLLFWMLALWLCSFSCERAWIRAWARGSLENHRARERLVVDYSLHATRVPCSRVV